ncbi:MAG: SDR family oxidoreductase [Gammaproteobacteria bacterium]|jgi:NAD(P)-dependent dehydrogenase (short-subunit alcohol dehydrogenase family)|nr:SDR family oxidoreductase [Gammaproteobacteria bacterium]
MSSEEMKPLTGKWALVTGSSRGIGQQIASGLAGRGCNVILHARKPGNCNTTLDLLGKFDVETRVVGAELGSPGQERKMIDSILQQVGYVDILYNNAAVMASWHDHIAEIPMQEWDDIYRINFFSLVRLCNAFYPLMRSRNWGRIVNLVTGMENTPQLTPYSASKASVEKYTRELAAELCDTNVLVNALDPGWLKTDLGGATADYAVETVLPGALVPALLENDGARGTIFRAQDYRTN